MLTKDGREDDVRKRNPIASPASSSMRTLKGKSTCGGAERSMTDGQFGHPALHPLSSTLTRLHLSHRRSHAQHASRISFLYSITIVRPTGSTLNAASATPSFSLASARSFGG